MPNPQNPIQQNPNQPNCLVNCPNQQQQQTQNTSQNSTQRFTPTPTRASSGQSSGSNGSLQTLVPRSCPAAGAPVINILFVGQGFSSNDAFTAAVKAKTDMFLSTEPWKTYKAAFQVTGVNSSQDFGCLASLQLDAVRRAQQLAAQGQQDPLQAQCVNGVMNVAQQYPHDVVVSLSNGTGYNSYANFPPLSFVISMTNFSDASGKQHANLNADNIFLHEMGHALGNLADEYNIPGMTSPPYPKKDNCASSQSEADNWELFSEVKAELNGQQLGVQNCALSSWLRPVNGGSMMDTDNYNWTKSPEVYGAVENHIMKQTLAKYAACLNAPATTSTPTVTPKAGSAGVPPTSQFNNNTPTPGNGSPINIKTFTIKDLTPGSSQ